MKNNPFITEEHLARKKRFRVLGPIILGLGILCFGATIFSMATGFVFNSPIFIFSGFIGVFLIGIGSNLCKLGYQADVANYNARELAPVARDTINYLVNETQDSVEQIARAVSNGNSDIVQVKQCKSCNEFNKLDANFCNNCGAPI